jgi:hypothetical protein
MLNPSTADAEQDDPTIRRCVAFSKRWGFDGLIVVNLFALRATDPAEVLQVIRCEGLAAAVGYGNPFYQRDAMRHCETVVAAWGASLEPWSDEPARVLRADAEDVAEGLRRCGRKRDAALHCLGTTKSGAPRHPLYVASNTEPRRWP